MLREVGDLEVVAALTASRIMTADLGHHGRLAGGPAVGMASVIDVGTVMLGLLGRLDFDDCLEF